MRHESTPAVVPNVSAVGTLLASSQDDGGLCSVRCCERHDLSPHVLLRSDAFDVRQLQGVFPRRELNRDQFAYVVRKEHDKSGLK